MMNNPLSTRIAMLQSLQRNGFEDTKPSCPDDTYAKFVKTLVCDFVVLAEILEMYSSAPMFHVHLVQIIPKSRGGGGKTLVRDIKGVDLNVLLGQARDVVNSTIDMYTQVLHSLSD